VSGTAWDNQSCTQTPIAADITLGQCSPGDDSFDGYTVTPPTPVEGECAPSTPKKTALTGARRICTLTTAVGSPCPPGAICLPEGGAVLPYCNVVPAGTACAAGWMQGATLHAYTDARSCDCTCSDPAGATCNGAVVEIRTQADCTGSVLVSIPVDGECVGSGEDGKASLLLATPPAWAPGTCTPATIAAGSVSFGDGITLCCAP
jgi:hypothetical protein